MTRKSKRELERLLDSIEQDATGGDGDVIVVEHGPGPDNRRVHGEDPDEASSEDLVIHLTNHVVMGRERAEREDVEILGPAKDAPPGRDAVRVNPNP